MKIKNSTALLLATILTFSVGVFTLKTGSFYKVKADDTETINLDEYYSQSYFKNLAENFGRNYMGTCAFVATEMLLSYYDNFLCDDIVPEEYDAEYVSDSVNVYNSQKSPGTMDDLISDAVVKEIIGYTPEGDDGDDENDDLVSNHLTMEQYFNIVEERANDSLHCKLISLYRNKYGDGINLTENDTVHLIDEYLQEIAGFEKNEDYFLSSSYFTFVPGPNYQRLLRNDIINIVSSGKPVIMFISKASSGLDLDKHAVIAYDYDEYKDELYCHFGWHNNTKLRITPESEEYINYHGHIKLNWNIEHSCSNNYVVNGTPYCFEHKDLVVYDHLCSYTDGYQTFPITDPNEHIKHKKMCHCTNYVVENHTSTCGCSISAHVGSTYTYYSPTQHSYVCTLCGVTAYAPHVANINFPDYCITCKSFFDNGFGQIIHAIKPSGGMVTANGSYIGYNGIIYLDDRDVQAYFNGTLVFYKEDSSAQTA